MPPEPCSAGCVGGTRRPSSTSKGGLLDGLSGCGKSVQKPPRVERRGWNGRWNGTDVWAEMYPPVPPSFHPFSRRMEREMSQCFQGFSPYPFHPFHPLCTFKEEGRKST